MFIRCHLSGSVKPKNVVSLLKPRNHAPAVPGADGKGKRKGRRSKAVIERVTERDTTPTLNPVPVRCVE